MPSLTKVGTTIPSAEHSRSGRVSPNVGRPAPAQPEARSATRTTRNGAIRRIAPFLSPSGWLRELHVERDALRVGVGHELADRHDAVVGGVAGVPRGGVLLERRS